MLCGGVLWCSESLTASCLIHQIHHLIPIDTFDGIDGDSVESVKVLGHTARRKVEGLG